MTEELLPWPLPQIFAVITGLIAGSFFNVLIWRLPRGESIVRPRSRCPACGRMIRAIENIPVLSYIALRGKCAGCKTRISLRYPLVELLTGLAALALWNAIVEPSLGGEPWHIVLAGFRACTLLALIPISIIDIDHYIIPDSFTLPGFFIAAALSFLPGDITPLQAGLGALAGGGTLFAFGKIGEVLFRKEDAMGFGDVKLMAWLGALFGWQIALLGILFASLLGSIAGISLLLVRALRSDHHIPFGPFLAAGIWTAVLYGTPVVLWYIQLIDRFVLR